MQRQPESVFVVADAYRRELLADAARARRKTPRTGDRHATTRLNALRRSVGLVLIGTGTRLLGAGEISAERPAPALRARSV